MKKVRNFLSKSSKRNVALEHRRDVHSPYYPTEGEMKNYFYLFSDLNFNMLNDEERLGKLKQAILKVVKPDHTVIDLGAGTGILSLYAAKKAKRVYAVELLPYVYSLGKQTFSKHLYSDKIVFFLGDARSIRLPEVADVVICWIVDTALISELQIPVMNHAIKELVGNDYQVIPHSFSTQAQLVNINYHFDGLEYRLFSIETIHTQKRQTPLSKEKVFSSLNLTQVNALSIEEEFDLLATRNGILNGLKITSIAHLTDNIKLGPTIFSLRPYILPLPEDYPIIKGQKITVTISYKLSGGLGSLNYNVTLK
jgi:predicted RNA methylase